MGKLISSDGIFCFFPEMRNCKRDLWESFENAQIEIMQVTYTLELNQFEIASLEEIGLERWYISF